MASKQKFRKLVLGPSEPVTRKNSVQGMIVVGDYISPIDNQRTLVLEKTEAATLPRKRRSVQAKGSQDVGGAA